MKSYTAHFLKNRKRIVRDSTALFAIIQHISDHNNALLPRPTPTLALVHRPTTRQRVQLSRALRAIPDANLRLILAIATLCAHRAVGIALKPPPALAHCLVPFVIGALWTRGAGFVTDGSLALARWACLA